MNLGMYDSTCQTGHESVHSSSCDECEDGEFNNTLEVSKLSLPDTTDNIDVTLSIVQKQMH